MSVRRQIHLRKSRRHSPNPLFAFNGQSAPQIAMSESGNKSPEFDSILWLVIIGLVGLFAWIIVVPNLRPARVSSQNACINNLRQIDGAKQEWALENGKTNSVVCTVEDIKPYIKLNAKGDIPSYPQ